MSFWTPEQHIVILPFLRTANKWDSVTACYLTAHWGSVNGSGSWEKRVSPQGDITMRFRLGQRHVTQLVLQKSLSKGRRILTKPQRKASGHLHGRAGMRFLQPLPPPSLWMSPLTRWGFMLTMRRGRYPFTMWIPGSISTLLMVTTSKRNSIQL